MTKRELELVKKKYWLAVCIHAVDEYKVGNTYKAEETFYNDPPSDWKCHLPIQDRGLEEFYDSFKVYLPHSSRGFTKSVINNFFNISSYQYFGGIVAYNGNLMQELTNLGYTCLNKEVEEPRFLSFRNRFYKKLTTKPTEEMMIDCEDDEQLFLQIAKDNLSTLK